MATSGSWNISWESKYWSQTYNTKYYHWSGNWSKSGNTITLSNMKLWMTFTYASGGYGVSDTVTVTGGSAQTVNYPDWSNAYSTSQVSLNNTSFSVSSSSTSSTISCSIVDEYTGSTTISYDPSYVAPTTPTISISSSDASSVTVVYGTTSFGNPPTGTVTLYGGASASPTTALDTTTTTGDRSFTHTGLTSGTTYYYRARANNGQLNSNYSTEIAITLNEHNLYGSVNGETKKVEKLYGPAEKLDSLSSTKVGLGDGYISSFASSTFLNVFLSRYPSFLWKDYGELQRVTVVRGIGTRFNIEITTTTSTLTIPELRNTDLASWGITTSNYAYEYVNLTPSYTLAAKEIVKLYGSVNGQTKRIF